MSGSSTLSKFMKLCSGVDNEAGYEITVEKVRRCYAIREFH